jgi:hypothetical protein
MVQKQTVRDLEDPSVFWRHSMRKLQHSRPIVGATHYKLKITSIVAELCGPKLVQSRYDLFEFWVQVTRRLQCS